MSLISDYIAAHPKENQEFFRDLKNGYKLHNLHFYTLYEQYYTDYLYIYGCDKAIATMSKKFEAYPEIISNYTSDMKSTYRARISFFETRGCL